jgi:hypothetical protein
MRRPDADLEEKREPRVTGEPKRKTAAIEKAIRARLDIGRDREADLRTVGQKTLVQVI